MDKDNTPNTGGAASKGKDKKKTPLLTVEKHAQQQGVSPAVLAGVMELKNWFPGKAVDESEFNKAVAAFSKAPQGNIPKGGNR